MIRVALALAALVELGLARLLPETGAGLYLRLGAATILILLPGGLIAEALGQRRTSATLAWTLASLFAALTVTFALGASLSLTLVLLAAIAVAALPFALRRPRAPRLRGTGLVLAGGVLFGLLLWHAAGDLRGDALFHLARVRKLDELDSLSLAGVGEFADGGLHPGYAFPLWHGLVALVARLAGVDPAAVVLHAPSVLVPVAFLVAYEAATALFRSAWMGLATVAAQASLIGLAAGHGGGYNSLALPGTAARQLLVPALLALVFASLGHRSYGLLAAIAAGALALTLVHPTYTLFVLVPLLGFALVRVALTRRDAVALGAALAAVAVPATAALAWLAPVVRETASHTPAAREVQRGLTRYAAELDVVSEDRYRLAPDLFTRGGAIAVAALFLLPLAALAWRRRWGAWVLGGALALFALTLVAAIFPRFADLVSLSQARRAAGFVPLAFALAGGGAVLAYALGVFVLPLALTAGIGLQLAYPGDFVGAPDAAGPAIATWVAAVGGLAALVLVAAVRRPREPTGRPVLGALAVALFLLPVAVHGLANWGPRQNGGQRELTAGLVAALRSDVPEGSVVFSDLGTSYRIAAYAPLYVAAAPPAHVADTTKNRPYERRDDVVEFLRTGRLEVPRRYGAGWLVVDRQRFRHALDLPIVHRDPRYVLYRLEGPSGN